jgi:hypothetical protein
MPLFSSFRIAPGIRLSTSSRGLRLHAGPRLARVHVGGGRTGVSTGAGPFTWYENVGGSQRRTPSARAVNAPGMTPAQVERARLVEEVRAAWERLHAQHRVEFPAAMKPGPVAAEPVPMFEVLLRNAETAALSGVGRLDRSARRAARHEARVQAEAEALTLLESGLGDQQERQRLADAHWSALIAGVPTAVESALAKVFRERGIRVIVEAVSTETVRLSVELPGAEVVPSHAPSVTAAGAPTVKKVTKTEVAAAVREVAASRLLLAGREAFAASPTTTLLQVDGGFGDGPSVIRARMTRQGLESAPWSLDAWDVLHAVDPEVEVNVGGRTRELRPIT